ncbi:hypothetical protein [Calothrix sp. PCC 7507]|uniref:hypothetical protein n=1 Tax=Calothrix sp. PCC 7507 TaxID=99598 RepID=UPI00029EEEBE|nr:hypothetical protein [Calothrix sp. PCC 7507]AFY36093.1 hypothetical protein Cal7507_5774 [Calothrix sp. PCC 7507]
MNSLIKRSPFIDNLCKLSRGVILTLTLTSLLSCGIGLTDKSPSTAAPTTEQNQLSQNSQKLPRDISRNILRDASKRSGLKIAKLKITEIIPETFANPCIFNFGEVCTREYKPIEGWEVIVNVKAQSWTYHVNKSGSQIILDPQINLAANTQLPKAIANTILTDAAKRSGVAIASLKITDVKFQTFGNACEFNFGEICAQIYKPIEGWEVIVKVKAQSWTYHVDKSGLQIVLEPRAK